jgi:hypothetical protein
VKQGLVHKLVNVKLIVLSDIRGTINVGLEACVFFIRVKVDARNDAGGLWCHAFGLHPQQ